MVGVLRAFAVAASLAASGCSDEIVGEFVGASAMGEAGGGTMAPDPSSGTTTAPAPTSNGESSDSSGGVPVPTWTEGCFSDNFDDDTLDEDLWNTWVEADAQFNEIGGWLKFDPPTSGLSDTGVITNWLHVLSFENATTRMEVPSPPDTGQPVALFLQVLDDVDLASISVGGGEITIRAQSDGMVTVNEDFVRPPPAWLGIRGAGSELFFEISDDGVTWETLARRDKPGAFVAVSPLVMVQTYGEAPEAALVSIDNFETCVE